MPRAARLEVPGIPLHVTHRGVNRCAVFHDDADRSVYLSLLRRHLSLQHVALHAYVLMTNHVHLLLSAPSAGTISRALRNAVQCYVRWFNARHSRTGTLWECRFKSCLVDTDRYLLSVIRYIELNPVRAALVADPADFPWSSVRVHLARRWDPSITQHPSFLALGPDRRQRASAYAQWLSEPLDPVELAAIRLRLVKQRVYGSAAFEQRVGNAIRRPVVCRERGRPPRDEAIVKRRP